MQSIQRKSWYYAARIDHIGCEEGHDQYDPLQQHNDMPVHPCHTSATDHRKHAGRSSLPLFERRERHSALAVDRVIVRLNRYRIRIPQ